MRLRRPTSSGMDLSLGVPREILRELGLEAGVYLSVNLVDGSIIYTPVPEKIAIRNE